MALFSAEAHFVRLELNPVKAPGDRHWTGLARLCPLLKKTDPLVVDDHAPRLSVLALHADVDTTVCAECPTRLGKRLGHSWIRFLFAVDRVEEGA